ncbi:hypothetical protein G7Y89_g3312 [Cudoniella acicularis]|uniref:DJ-1/PfpI domain-containing protein n=1 Tax=Cudoniella acicularis TaxID=354080 RepID=A0A8H4RST9_9HELO|nr:hypothetical protein G7Y89_g3312 [Cudoniella acicularis]
MASIQFGILMVPYQTIDAAGPTDILFCCSRALISQYENASLPGFSGLSEKAIPIEFHYINETLDPVTLSSNFKALPSTTCDDCPPLDYLLIGGPDMLTFQLSPRFEKFIQEHVKAGKGIFTTCTGGFAIASSGVLDGKRATTNHGALEMAMQAVPNVKWVKEQWVQEGNIWTAGGACAGMDMMAHWVVENYGMEIAKIAFGLLDFQPRDVQRKLIDLS